MDMAANNTGGGNPRKKPCGTGRRKVEIKRIEGSSRRMVAFSKRKKGLFNKARELHRLCDAGIAVIIFSSTGRPFTFGKPSVDHIIDRFLRDGAAAAGDEKENASSKEEEEELMLQLGDSEDEDEDNEEEEEEEEVRVEGEGGFWWEESIEGLSLEETEKFKASLETIRNNVALRLEEILMRRDCERNFF